MRKNWWRIALVILLMGVLLFLFFRSVDWGEVWSHLVDVNLPLFVLAVILIPTHVLTRAIRWKYLLQHEKENVSLYNRFAANAIGFTVTLTFPGRLGEVVKPLYLAQKEKMSKSFVIGTAIVERIFDIFTNCALLGIFLVSKPLYASLFQIDEEMYSQLSLWGIIGGSVAVGMLLFMLGLYFMRERTLALISFFLKPLPQKIADKILNIISEFIQGLSFFRSLKSLVAYLVWSFIVWLAIIFSYWIFLMAYDIRVTYFFLIPFVFLLMVGASIPTPGMVGGFHSFSKLGLTTFYGIESNRAIGITIVMHALQVVTVILIGYIILWKEGKSIFHIKKIGEEPES
jgi:uncharacterized protein (TIRG00374 family)